MTSCCLVKQMIWMSEYELTGVEVMSTVGFMSAFLLYRLDHFTENKECWDGHRNIYSYKIEDSP